MSAIESLGPICAHSASLHGHLCPRQVLGVCMGHAAITTAPLVLVDLLADEGITGCAYVFCYTPLAL